MQKIPKNLPEDAWSGYLQRAGLTLLSQGKVRDTWRVNEDTLAVIATDRISIFDFVLNTLVPKKGEVLTALTHFWLTSVLSHFPNHLIQSNFYGRKTNAAVELKRVNFYGKYIPEIPLERCLLVKDLTGQMYPFEMIFRHHIGGSVYKKYLETGMAGGQRLAPWLPKWSKLAIPLFTPSTKEAVGHDINVNADYFYSEMKKIGKEDEARATVAMLTKAYIKAYAYAEKRGMLILDTKFEVSEMMLADEILTPDSSRFALKKDWERAMKEGRDPQFYDKEPVREWGRTVKTPFGVTGINNLNPENPEHLEFVHNIKVPNKVITDCSKRNLKTFKLITGKTLGNYQKNDMKIFL